MTYPRDLETPEKFLSLKPAEIIVTQPAPKK